MAGKVKTLVLTVDLEDWQQLARRRIGDPTWDWRRPQLARQCEALLEGLERLSLKATFFVLGLTAKRYPELVQEVAAAGHEIACHGYNHRPLYLQSPREAREDLARSSELLAELCGAPPLGYRAPAFSLTARSSWTLELLAELGFRYDCSLHASPRIPDRLDHPLGPHRLGPRRALWELPVAVWQLGGRTVPVGGGAYWRLLPRRTVLAGLRAAAERSCVYLHPYEYDPRPLRLELERDADLPLRLRARLRELARNPRKGRIPLLLEELGHTFRLVHCKEAIEQLERTQQPS